MAPRPQLSVQYEPGCAPSVEVDMHSLSYTRVLSKVSDFIRIDFHLSPWPGSNLVKIL